jgi:hypothetical protein
MSRAGWGVPAITLALYPFGAGASAINLFFAALVGSWIGGPVLTPVQSLIGGLLIGVPVTWAFACHIRRLMDRADG